MNVFRKIIYFSFLVVCMNFNLYAGTVGGDAAGFVSSLVNYVRSEGKAKIKTYSFNTNFKSLLNKSLVMTASFKLDSVERWNFVADEFFDALDLKVKMRVKVGYLLQELYRLVVNGEREPVVDIINSERIRLILGNEYDLGGYTSRRNFETQLRELAKACGGEFVRERVVRMPIQREPIVEKVKKEEIHHVAEKKVKIKEIPQVAEEKAPEEFKKLLNEVIRETEKIRTRKT